MSETTRLARCSGAMTTDGRARACGCVLLQAAGLALLPKCPLCVAAALSALGVGVGMAGVMAPLLQPVAWVVALIASTSIVWRYRRRSRTRPALPCSAAREGVGAGQR